MVTALMLVAVLGKPLQDYPFGSDARMAAAVLCNFLGLPRSAVTIEDITEPKPGRFAIKAHAAPVEGYKQILDTTGDLTAQVVVRGGYVAYCAWTRPLHGGGMQMVKGPPWPKRWRGPLQRVMDFMKSRVPSFSLAWWTRGPGGAAQSASVFLSYGEGEKEPWAIDASVGECEGPGPALYAGTERYVDVQATLPAGKLVTWRHRFTPFVDLSEVKVDSATALKTAMAIADKEGWGKRLGGTPKVTSGGPALYLGDEDGPRWSVFIDVKGRTGLVWVNAVTGEAKVMYPPWVLPTPDMFPPES